EITDGAFYVVWLMLTATSGLAEDQTPTQAFSRQAWEYTGVWSPYRAAETSYFMLRARISPVAGPNQPPEIVNYYPTDLDTVELNDAVDFGVTATDPDGDPLSYVWKLDDVVQGTDSTVTIIFDELGAHEVGVWVSDGELSDSMFWDVTVVAVGVEPFERILPTEYALQTPHPNPFNPTTTITFSLPLAGDVRLSVYDQTGREIAKLVAGWRPAGTHDVVFDATGLSSGIYLVKMMTGNFTASQKIVMMK
ncbi:MAG TPA: T9SS type A sorting domain-containing protein, partial [bacterium]